MTAASDHFFHAIFEAEPHCVKLLRRDGVLLQMNPAGLKLIEAEDFGQVDGCCVFPLVARRHRARFKKLTERVFRGDPGTLQFEMTGLKGTRRWMETHATPLRDERGRIIALLGITHDISERKQAEASLIQQGRLLRRVLDTNPTTIFVKDRDSRILMANRATANFYGLTVEETVGRRQDELHRERGRNPEDLRKWLADDREVIDTGRPIDLIESGTDAHGHRHYFHTQKHPFEYEPGHAAVLVVSEDITERYRAEEAVRASHEQLRRLAQRLQVIREEERARIAREIHDALAQELTRLKLDLAWIRRRISQAVDETTRVSLLEKVASMTELIAITSESVHKLANDLRPVVLDSLGLGPAIEWQVEEFQSRTGIACAARVPPGLPALDRARATALFRIMQESLTNVVRHARARHVEVALVVEGGSLRLTVCDDGRGITPEELADPRAIGLLGMKERAALLGGETNIAAAPGGGTRVQVTLPLPEPDNLKQP